jgi:hypothetical protein
MSRRRLPLPFLNDPIMYIMSFQPSAYLIRCVFLLPAGATHICPPSRLRLAHHHTVSAVGLPLDRSASLAFADDS